MIQVRPPAQPATFGGSTGPVRAGRHAAEVGDGWTSAGPSSCSGNDQMTGALICVNVRGAGVKVL